MNVGGNVMVVCLSSDEIVSSSIILHDLGAEVPSTVIVERIAGISSCAGIWSLFATSGSTIVMHAWSSMIANPSMQYSELGRVKTTGHVRLYD